MSDIEKNFISASETATDDVLRKNVLLKNLNHYYSKFETGKSQFEDIELARKKLYYAKYKSIENLEKNLTEFETHFKARGGKIFYASGKEETLQYILKVLQNTGSDKVVKSKSMVCEEIGLEDFMKKHDISVLETDLGEFIVQVAGERPSHITAPALHKSKKEIYDLLNEKFDQAFNDSTNPEIVVQFVRNLLRDEFEKAGIGITGCNFLIAKQGAIAVTENEANALLSASFPKIQIVVTSIEKMIYSFDSLELFQTMLASHGTGQMITAYNHLIFGPAKENELSGPEEIHLILINNNRTDIIENIHMRQAVYCIKCGACHNFCPVYRQIGGHTYQSVYNGPIGSVISPYIFGKKDFYFLPFASSLCGKCNDVCPVRINITSLLIQERKNIVHSKLNSNSERKLFKRLNKILLKRKRMDRYSSFFKNTALKFFLRKTWGKEREIPLFAKQSFNKIKKSEEN